jgi:hypothetical protein
MRNIDFHKQYIHVAIIFFNACLIFLLGNIVVWAALEARLYLQGAQNQPEIVRRYGLDNIRAIYPDLEDEDISRLLNESRGQFEYELFTIFKESPRKGKFVNVSMHGFRHVENQGPWPINPAAYNIFVFGWSFGYGIKDSDTIPSYLQKFLANAFPNNDIHVYNFGRGAYFSTQERILFENLITKNVIPDYAIFIDGFNDSVAGGIEEGRAELMKEKIIQSEASEELNAVNRIPVMRVITSLKNRINSAQDSSDSLLNKSANQGYIKDEAFNKRHSEAVIRNYIANKTMLESIAERYDMRSLFVWQPIPHYKYNLKLHGLMDSEFSTQHFAPYIYKKMERTRKNTEMGGNFLWLADIQENATEMYYVDRVHYNPALSEKVAAVIASRIQNELKLPLKALSISHK